MPDIREWKIRTEFETHAYVMQIINGIPNKTDSEIIREIITTSLTKRDWEAVTGIIHKYAPETRPEGSE